ncbi:MAG TPA: response regulator transcription factor [Bryobacteraceae bacterium]|nr:response regulator transcription factor [Bryobacteraceae bacterium]
MKRWKLLLADDHDIVIAGLRQVLDQPNLEIVGAVKDGRALVECARELKPDVVVTDVTMPLLNGLDAAKQIRMLDPKVKIVFLTMHSEVGYAVEALSLGNCGYVLKSSVADELVPAIHEVLKGGTYVAQAIAEPVRKAIEGRSQQRAPGVQGLTSRQREVLQLLAEGRPVKEIAFRLGVSPRTIEFHKYRIMEELGVRSVAELVRSAMSLGILK